MRGHSSPHWNILHSFLRQQKNRRFGFFSDLENFRVNISSQKHRKGQSGFRYSKNKLLSTASTNTSRSWLVLKYEITFLSTTRGSKSTNHMPAPPSSELVPHLAFSLVFRGPIRTRRREPIMKGYILSSHWRISIRFSAIKLALNSEHHSFFFRQDAKNKVRHPKGSEGSKDQETLQSEMRQLLDQRALIAV